MERAACQTCGLTVDSAPAPLPVTFDGYQASGVSITPVHFGTVTLSAGMHTFTFTATGTDAASAGNRYVIGIDTLSLIPTGTNGPSVGLNLPATGLTGTPVTADATTSYPGTAAITGYTFDFGDGTVVGPQPAASASHTYATAGSYLVKVTATAGNGATVTNTSTVAVTGPAAVLDSFLRQLGVPGQQIPESTDERAAMFRDRLDGRHALVLLDNAADLDQVRHLIPSSPTCLVIVTSRRNFAGLQGSSQLLLETFSMSEAVDLLAAIAGGHRIFAEPEAARRVAELCGRLPLAVALSGARLRSRPAWSVAELAKRLEQDGIDAVSAGEHPLRAVFDLSYRGLAASTRRLFALLGLYPGEDFSCEAAAALAGVDRTQARRTLEILQDEHVLQQKAPGRYSLHDLLRDYAAGRAEAEMAEGERRGAIRTALAWHVAVVTLTTLAISPDRVMPPIDPEVAHISAPQAFNAAEAVLWYGRERANLMQAVEAAGRLGFGSLAWRLPIAMAYFEELAQNYRELERLMSTALPHARADADPDAETSVVRWLTFALRAQGRAAEAIGPLNRVLEARRAEGDRLSVGRILGSLAEAHIGIGDPGRALQLVQEAIRTIEETGGPVPSSFLTITSMCLMRLGRLIEALTYQVAFVERARKADDPRAAALGQHNVGDNYLLQGRMEEAAEAFEEAITLAAETGDRYVQADCLNGLAVSLRARGLIEAARARHREAVAVFDDLPEQEAARYLAQLDASSLRYVE